jgi:signal transduction histidine kinase
VSKRARRVTAGARRTAIARYNDATRVTAPRGLSLRWTFLAATALAALSATLVYNITIAMGQPLEAWTRLVVLNAFYWYVWAVFAQPIGWLSVRFPLERLSWKRSVPVHLLSVIAFSTSHIVLVTWFQYLTRPRPWAMKFSESLRRSVIQNFDWEMMTYWAIVGVTHALVYYRESQQRNVTAAQLEAKLAAVQLQNLQAQLQPHFFFNTLHAISALMHRDVNAADRMLTRLSDLLRLSLARIGVAEVPLKEEIEFVQKYAEIECTRYRDRLAVTFDIEPETLDALVPNLILQPIVENAIKHGIAPRSGPGHVVVVARRDGRWLAMEVQDDGVGLSEEAFVAVQKGIGVSNTRARLNHQYGSRYRFEFSRRPAGLVVRVVIPWHTTRPVADGVQPLQESGAG